jgi:pyridoxal phosphate enzyme (YggS family)
MAGVRLAEVEERVEAAVARAGRQRADVRLVAIGKSQPIGALREAYEQGQRLFGENRARELVTKATELPEDIEWHFVGHLQRNKVRHVRPIVELLHSMDSAPLGTAWLKGPGLAPPVLVEVNIGDEPQKPGVAIPDVERLVGTLIELGIDVRGLMAVPPMAEDPEITRSFFRDLRHLRDQISKTWSTVAELSMGMTDDFEVAIEEGSTMIRVGRAIFGPRMTRGTV